jgi:hypothetical protein
VPSHLSPAPAFGSLTLAFAGAASGDDMNLTSACAVERVLGTPREILGAPPMCKG